jgi:hypothetical protein
MQIGTMSDPIRLPGNEYMSSQSRQRIDLIRTVTGLLLYRRSAVLYSTNHVNQPKRGVNVLVNPGTPIVLSQFCLLES